MTLDELIHYVNLNLTFSGALPQYLNNQQIENIIENIAKPYFHRDVFESKIKEYIYIPKNAFMTEKYTQYKYVELPCTTQTVVWLYQVNDTSLFSLGVQAPNLSVNLGVTNQPYLSSSVSSIGELGVYKVIIDGFADMLNTLTKHTLKFDYNRISKQLNILTAMGMSPYQDNRTALIAEVYSSISDEDLYESTLFRQYVDAECLMQLGNMLLMFDITLPGASKINASAILSAGTAKMDKFKEEFNRTKPTNAIITMTKR
jgi:hypothetical protein